MNVDFFHKNCSEGNNEQLLLYSFLLFCLFTEPVNRIPVHRDASALYIVTFRELLLCGSNLSAKMYKNIYLTYLKIWKNDFAETLAHKNIPLKMAYYPLHTPCQNIFFGTTQKVSEITPHWKWAIFLAFLKLKGNFSLLGLNSCEFRVMAAIFDNFGIFKSTHIVHTLVQVIVYTGLCSFFHAAAFVTLGHPIPFVSTTTTCRAHSQRAKSSWKIANFLTTWHYVMDGQQNWFENRQKI